MPWIFNTYLVVGETPNDANKNEVFMCVTCAAADRQDDERLAQL